MVDVGRQNGCGDIAGHGEDRKSRGMELIRVNSVFLLVFDSVACTRGSRQTLISSHLIRSGSIRYNLFPRKTIDLS